MDVSLTDSNFQKDGFKAQNVFIQEQGFVTVRSWQYINAGGAPHCQVHLDFRDVAVIEKVERSVRLD
jgi:hypothetical protein